MDTLYLAVTRCQLTGFSCRPPICRWPFAAARTVVCTSLRERAIAVLIHVNKDRFQPARGVAVKQAGAPCLAVCLLPELAARQAESPFVRAPEIRCWAF